MIGKRLKGKGKGKLIKTKGNLAKIDEVGIESESPEGAKKYDKSQNVPNPRNTVDQTTREENLPSESNSNGQNTTSQGNVDGRLRSSARKRTGNQAQPPTSPYGTKKAFRPNVFDKFFPKDSLLSVTDAESRELEDEDESGTMEATKDYGENSGALKTANDDNDVQSPINATREDGMKMGERETTTNEDGDVFGATNTTSNQFGEKSDGVKSNGNGARGETTSKEPASTHASPDPKAPPDPKVPSDPKAPSDANAPSNSNALSDPNAPSDPKATPANQVLSSPEVMRRDAASVVLRDWRRDSNFHNRKAALLSLADGLDPSLPNTEDLFGLTKGKEVVFPFGNLFHSTPLQQTDAPIGSPELSLIAQSEGSELSLPRSLLVVSSQIVPPDFSDEEQLKDVAAGALVKARKELTKDSFCIGEGSDEYLVKSLKPIKRRNASGKDTGEASAGKEKNKSAEGKRIKTAEDKGKGPGRAKGKGKEEVAEGPTKDGAGRHHEKEVEIPMELDLIDPNESPVRTNAVPNEVLMKAKRNNAAEKRTDAVTDKNLNLGGKTQSQGQQQQPGPSRPANTTTPAIIIPTSYVNQKLSQPSCSNQGVKKVSKPAAKDPYAPEDSDDDDYWGLDAFESFAARLKRNSSMHVKKTYQGGRVKGMEAEKRKTAMKKMSCPGYFSASILEFGREMDDGSTNGSSDDSTDKSKKLVWSNKHLPQMEIESDDDECFLCKYKRSYHFRHIFKRESSSSS